MTSPECEREPEPGSGSGSESPAQASSSSGAELPLVRELVGVYHATGTVVGELTYWVKARIGRGHCALCDITHGTFRERADWRVCRDGLSVPFEAVHLDEQSEAVRAVSLGSTPCVVARTDDGHTVLVSAAELEACSGSPPLLVDRIVANAERDGLRLER